MDQVNSYADSRLLQGCIYCDDSSETRDHVPSKCLLESPYPENLPVVGCCVTCNQNFSRDEQYFACLIESALCGSTDPEKIGRPSVARIMQKLPSLRQRIEDSKTEVNGQVAFILEIERVNNVMLKLARGHAAFELSKDCRAKPDHFWWGTLSSLPQEAQHEFNSVHVQHNVGEMSSRNMQRLFVMQVTRKSENGELVKDGMVVNDWVDVQDNRYRYIAIDDMGKVIIRIVIAEFFACEVGWEY